MHLFGMSFDFWGGRENSFLQSSPPLSHPSSLSGPPSPNFLYLWFVRENDQGRWGEKGEKQECVTFNPKRSLPLFESSLFLENIGVISMNLKFLGLNFLQILLFKIQSQLCCILLKMLVFRELNKLPKMVQKNIIN